MTYEQSVKLVEILDKWYYEFKRDFPSTPFGGRKEILKGRICDEVDKW